MLDTASPTASVQAPSTGFPPIHLVHPRGCYDYRWADTPLGGPKKRLVDLIVSAAALAVLAAPFLIIALLIRLDSPGPVFFRQARTGFRGRTFTILKFRTMRADAEHAAPVQARPGDTRITRVGRVLRATSLDELPQLLNVVWGDMSIVGPRPHAVAHDCVFYGVNPEYPRRFLARPGITGLAQVAGARGRTATAAEVEARLCYDFEYIENWSLWRDFIIMLRTVGIVFSRRNAF